MGSIPLLGAGRARSFKFYGVLPNERRMLRWTRVALGLLSLSAVAIAPRDATAVIDPASATDTWRAILYPAVAPDWSDDQQTGISEADIVGNATRAGAYVQFDDAGTPDPTDGEIAFRVRLGADKNPPGFEHFFGVGLDADLDGDLDLFLGVDNSGNPDQIGIWDPGTGLNVSPSTTSIVNPPLVSYAETLGNYDFRAVDATIEPGETIFDLDADGETDHFLSFVVPFTHVVNALVARGFPGFDERTRVSYVIGTSTQPNALNQDLGGPDGGTNSTSTFVLLGALSNPESPLPEPAGLAPAALALVVALRAGRAGFRRAG
jgi:hypothetical protein